MNLHHFDYHQSQETLCRPWGIGIQRAPLRQSYTVDGKFVTPLGRRLALYAPPPFLKEWPMFVFYLPRVQLVVKSDCQPRKKADEAIVAGKQPHRIPETSLVGCFFTPSYFLPSNADSRVSSSAYSNSPPTGRPFAK